MRPNPIKAIWDEGRAVINGWCVIPSSFSAEIMASLNWDSLTLDLQHGVIDYQNAVTMFQAISTTETAPMARVPWNDPSIIMKLLDAGAYGLICPMVNNREQAEAFVGACRYSPRGYRSSGPVRATLYAGADYMTHADDTVLTFAMIETTEALENLDKILSTPELDAIYVGPSDLSISMGGKPGLDQTEPMVVEAIGTIVAAAKRHGIRCGIQCGSTDYAKKMIADGFDLVTVLSDMRMIIAAGNRVLAEMRGE